METEIETVDEKLNQFLSEQVKEGSRCHFFIRINTNFLMRFFKAFCLTQEFMIDMKPHPYNNPVVELYTRLSCYTLSLSSSSIPVYLSDLDDESDPKCSHMIGTLIISPPTPPVFLPDAEGLMTSR